MYKTFPTRVLVFPCGSGIGQEVYSSLSHRRDIELYGLDSNDNTPGKALYGKRFYSGAPLLSDPVQLREYIKYFCSVNEIKYIIPGTDDSVNFLKEGELEIGATVVTSSLETCIIARSKKLTYQILGRFIRVPTMYTMEEVEEYQGFPVFVKPDKGAGSIGARRVDSMNELVESYKGDEIILENLHGPEYTVDCLTGSNGELLYNCPRQRSVARGGISIVTSRVDDEKIIQEVRDMAIKINNCIDLIGGWFFQVKHVEDSVDSPLCLLEIAPRVAGAMAFSRMSGVNLPLLSLNIAIGLPVKIGAVNHPDRTMKVYKTYVDPPLKFDNLYVDLDHTLVLHSKVNHVAMACLYKYHARGIPIHLITRRPTNLSDYLREFHIPESLFTSIKQIFDLESKKKFIVPNSVFIDDSFRERQDCSSVELNIISFDIDAFEWL